MVLTKAVLTENLFQVLGFNKRESKDLIDLFFEEMRLALERGESLCLSGFGNFKLRDKNTRPGRNPKTGVHVTIPPMRVVTFRVGQKLKARIEPYGKSKP